MQKTASRLSGGGAVFCIFRNDRRLQKRREVFLAVFDLPADALEPAACARNRPVHCQTEQGHLSASPDPGQDQTVVRCVEPVLEERIPQIPGVDLRLVRLVQAVRNAVRV